MNAKIVLGAYTVVSNGEEATVSYLMPTEPLQGEKYGYITYKEIVK